MSSLPVLLSIAGSDSGGGAGIQADLKTFQAFGAFGTTALTAVTCQNTQGVSAVQGLDPKIVSGQIKKVLEDFPVSAAKTGMLFSAEIIAAVRKTLTEDAPQLKLVLDPVMVASSGDRLLVEKEAEKELTAFLSYASLITPNLPEAELILGHPIVSIEDMKAAAQELYEKCQAIVLLKGGHRKSSEEPQIAVDIYYEGKRSFQEVLSYPRLQSRNTHGTGCTLSAAITAGLGKGQTYHQAVLAARAYLQKAIENAPPLGSGIGPVNHLWQSEQKAV